ncbi:MAG: glycosyltransferase family 4 protein [Gemmatimonadaceae bacterium]
MTLRVAFDATYQRQPDGGIARYARQLTAALRERGDVEVIEIGGGPSEQRGTVRRRLVTLSADFAWHPLLGRLRAAQVKAGVYHSPGLRGPLTRGSVPVVVTIHDLVPLLSPELLSRWARWNGRTTQKRMSLIADRVICNSGDTANDVERLFGVPRERVRVTPLGVEPAFFEPVTSGLPVREPYVLFVGSEQPRKNLERLERAVAILRSRGFPHVLVTVGADAWGRVQIGGPFVRKLGKVNDEELRRLYAGAACLAIPSLHEGFGLPALEAMAVGTPVVAARVAALPEITGGAAVLVDPLDTTDIADGLERAISERDTLIPRGRRRAREFTWARTAALTVDVYRELA